MCSQGQGFCAKAIIKIALKEIAKNQYPRENEPSLGATCLVNGEKVTQVTRLANNRTLIQARSSGSVTSATCESDSF
jgi:hypothetical protein